MSRIIGYSNQLRIYDFSQMMGSRKINILWLIAGFKKLYIACHKQCYALNEILTRLRSAVIRFSGL